MTTTDVTDSKRDPRESFRQLVADLLWTAGCEVDLSGTPPRSIKAQIFSPLGNQDVRIMTLPEYTSFSEIEVHQQSSGNAEKLILVTDGDVKSLGLSQGATKDATSVSDLIDHVFVKRRLKSYCSGLLKKRLGNDECQSEDDAQPLDDYQPGDHYQAGRVYQNYRGQDDPEEIWSLSGQSRRGGRQDSHLVPAGDALISFLMDDHKVLCCLTGGFGTGKTIESLLLSKRLTESHVNFSNGKAILPIYVNLSGAAARPVAETIAESIAVTYGVRAPRHVMRLLSRLQKYRNVITILDGIDEQLELHARALTHLWYSVLELPRMGIKAVASYRFEMFESWEVERQTITQGLDPNSNAWAYFRLAPLEVMSLKCLPETSDRHLPEIASELSRRPLWLSYVRRYLADKNHEPISSLRLIEFCLNKWEHLAPPFWMSSACYESLTLLAAERSIVKSPLIL